MARKMRIPHPSVTGMAAGFTILDELNGGAPSFNGFRGSATVLDSVLQGKFNDGLTNLSHNAQSLVKTQPGRTALLQAVGIAALGAWARKALPNVKIGGNVLYARI